MTMGIRGFKTKKELRAAVGTDITDKVIETSIFGNEFKSTGWNIFVGPSPTVRKWFARVRTEAGIVKEVE